LPIVKYYSEVAVALGFGYMTPFMHLKYPLNGQQTVTHSSK